MFNDLPHKNGFDVHFCDNLLPVPFTHTFKVELLTSKYLFRKIRSHRHHGCTKRTTPSDFRRTLRIIPKEPFPMTSRDSYASMKDVDDIEHGTKG